MVISFRFLALYMRIFFVVSPSSFSSFSFSSRFFLVLLLPATYPSRPVWLGTTDLLVKNPDHVFCWYFNKLSSQNGNCECKTTISKSRSYYLEVLYFSKASNGPSPLFCSFGAKTFIPFSLLIILRICKDIVSGLHYLTFIKPVFSWNRIVYMLQKFPQLCSMLVMCCIAVRFRLRILLANAVLFQIGSTLAGDCPVVWCTARRNKGECSFQSDWCSSTIRRWFSNVIFNLPTIPLIMDVEEWF